MNLNQFNGLTVKLMTFKYIRDKIKRIHCRKATSKVLFSACTNVTLCGSHCCTVTTLNEQNYIVDKVYHGL